MGLEQAREALETAHTSETEASGDLAPEVDGQTSFQAPNSIQELIELDNLEKFKFQGHEWTKTDLEKAILRQSDYTKKTQALAKERESFQKEQDYAKNLNADLQNVLKDPRLVDEFKKIYPAYYHGVLDRFLSNNQPSQTNQQVGHQSVQIDPVITTRLEEMQQRLSRFEAKEREVEVKAYEAEIDNIISEHAKKYPLADKATVLAQAQSLLDQGGTLTKDDGRSNPFVWDKIFKSVNDKNQKLFETHYKTQVQQQKQAGQKAKDIGAGGGTPGQAPQKVSLKEARENLRKHLDQG